MDNKYICTRFQCGANVSKTEHEECMKSDSAEQSRQHSGIVFTIPISWDINGEMCIILTSLCFFFKNEFLTWFSGCRGKAEASRARGCKSCWERRGFEVSFAKTSKIIFIPFSITLSPCVFWSQHDSPLLLSPYNRWWRHTGGKSVLALARSNATMRKCLHFWGWSFSRGYI